MLSDYRVGFNALPQEEAAFIPSDHFALLHDWVQVVADMNYAWNAISCTTIPMMTTAQRANPDSR